MNGLIDGAIGRARMVLAFLVCAVLAGAYVYATLPKESDPDIALPFVSVTVPLQGVTPEDAERLLVRPIEQEVRSIEGLKMFEGIAMEGAGVLILEFEITTDIDQAVLDVRQKVDMAKRFFPEAAREPIVSEINASQFPVLVINLSGDAPERGLYTIAENLKQRLEADASILEARVTGRRDDVLEITVDPVKLQDYNLSYQEIFAAVAANNQLIPAGEIDTGQGNFAVKVPGLITKAEDALSLPVRRTQNSVVTLGDVASVRRTYLDPTSFATFNGEPALLIEVIKRPGANVLETAGIVRTAIEQEQASWPSTVKAEITSDSSRQTRNQLSTLESALMTAIILVMIVCVATVGLRSALLIGVAIPSSFVIAFLLLGAFGYTVNMMVLFGLVISVGILVDGAIIVVEYADRKMAEGLDKKEAFALAGKRMFWPVVSSTLTAMVAFLPFLFWNSIPGKFMAYLPITLIFVLAASLVMALIFLPALGSVFGKHTASDDENLKSVAAHGDITKATGWLGAYLNFARELIRRPLIVSGAAIALILLIFVWFGAREHRSEFFLDIEPEQAYVFVQAQGPLSAEESAALVRAAEKQLEGIGGISSISTRTAVSQSGFNFDGVSGLPVDTIGQMLLDLKTSEGGEFNGHETIKNVRARLEKVPGLRFEVKPREQGPPSGKDVQVALRSNDQAALDEVTTRIRAHMETLEDQNIVREIDDTRPLPGIEYRMIVDRAEAGKFGVDISQVGAAVQLVTNGILVGRYRPDDAPEEVDIRVRFPEEVRNASALDSLRIATPQGSVPLSLFVDRVPAQRVSQISRRDGMRIYSVRANAFEQGKGAVIVADLKKWIAEQKFPASVDVKFEGADEDTADAGKFFAGATIAVLFMMAIILLWEFNNFWQVALTLTAVVTSTAGVLIGAEIMLPYISILMLGTGVVALAGIVVNHNIVLIDTFNRLIREGYSAEDAAIGTMGQRMRPVLLTTYTTVLGLLPSMFKVEAHFWPARITVGGAGAEWWVQLSVAIVFGLTFSTLMILFVTPVWLLVPTYVGRWWRRQRGLPEPRENEVRLLDTEVPEVGRTFRPAAE